MASLSWLLKHQPTHSRSLLTFASTSMLSNTNSCHNCLPHRAEPILSHLQKDPHTLVLPLIDNIMDSNLEYKAGSESAVQGFLWDMHFWWMPAGKRLIAEQSEKTDPIKWEWLCYQNYATVSENLNNAEICLKWLCTCISCPLRWSTFHINCSYTMALQCPQMRQFNWSVYALI